MGYTKEQREAKQKELDLANQNQNKIEDKLENDSKTDNVSTQPVTTTINKKMNIRNIPLSTNVLVVSNCYGQLIYKNKNTGLSMDWDNFGSEQYLSLNELLAMRNTYRKFFEKNWIVIKGFIDHEYAEMFSVEEILDFLQVSQYYKNMLCPDNFDDLFKMSPDEIENRIGNLSSGVKNSIVVRANELIENGVLDSLRVINVLEKTLNCELSRP